MPLCYSRLAAVVLLLSIMFATTPATAGPVYLALVIDPPTTAGAGVPGINRQYGSGTFSVTSNQSGPGTYHLYALDTIVGSYGIKYFNVPIFSFGTLGPIFNRSPIGTFENLDADSNSENSNSVGFSDPILRSGSSGSVPVNPIQAAQFFLGLRIGGFGISPGSFNDPPNIPVPSDHRDWVGVTSGQWGNYATDPDLYGIYAGKSWLFLGEGSYSGQAPLIDTANSRVDYYTSANFQTQGTASSANQNLAVFGSCVLTGCKPYFVPPQVINNVNANIPGMVMAPFVTNNGVDIWSDFQLLSFSPGPNASGSGPAVPAEFDPVTHKLIWNTLGSPVGTYVWGVTATNIYGSTQGTVTVNITAVPEPTTITLLALLPIASLFFRARRR